MSRATMPQRVDVSAIWKVLSFCDHNFSGRDHESDRYPLSWPEPGVIGAARPGRPGLAAPWAGISRPHHAALTKLVRNARSLSRVKREIAIQSHLQERELGASSRTKPKDEKRAGLSAEENQMPGNSPDITSLRDGCAPVKTFRADLRSGLQCPVNLHAGDGLQRRRDVAKLAVQHHLVEGLDLRHGVPSGNLADFPERGPCHAERDDRSQSGSFQRISPYALRSDLRRPAVLDYRNTSARSALNHAQIQGQDQAKADGSVSPAPGSL